MTEKFQGDLLLKSVGLCMFCKQLCGIPWTQSIVPPGWRKHILAQTSFQLAPKTFWWAELISQFFFSLNSSKNITCQLGKLTTEFTSPIAKSTSPGLSDTNFFARCSSESVLKQRSPEQLNILRLSPSFQTGPPIEQKCTELNLSVA